MASFQRPESPVSMVSVPPAPIAIIGMGCRYPGGADTPSAFWHLIRNGVDSITEVPSSRWDVDSVYDPDVAVFNKINTRWGGFLDQIDEFDPQFFGIAPREIITMDPQQRLLLEVTWDALEDAGQVPDQLRGSQTGVFVGVGTHDYSILLWQQAVDNPYAITGTGNCITANRISYLFDFKGPSLAIDTACSSSLVSVHLACQSLRSGESELAIAAGVNVMLLPTITSGFSNGGFMSSSGRCQSFDANADGYVRSEGSGAVVLKPLDKALADRDPIYAVIYGSAVNQDGSSPGIAAPNGKAQVEVLRTAYHQADIDPAQVQYVEAHGTGTKIGDPIEAEALGSVLGEGRSPDHPCIIGSVKSNIGHTETAAGVTGLIKAALMLKHQEIPPSLHFHQPNPAIDFEGLKLRVQTELSPFPKKSSNTSATSEPTYVGVNSFGFGGTNAHVILGRPTPSPSQEGDQSILTPRLPNAPTPQLLILSAKTDRALSALVQKYDQWFEEHPEADLASVCMTARTRRSHFSHRLACLAASVEEMRSQLQHWQNGDDEWGVLSGHGTAAAKDPAKTIAFLFTGQGSQYIDMGRELYETQHLFRETLDRCAEILLQHDVSLLELIYPDLGEAELSSGESLSDSTIDALTSEEQLNQTINTQPALFAIEYALAQLWMSWGVQPDAMVGHSIGEYVAACVAGVFELEDALRLIAARGRLMQALPSGGTMVSVVASVKQVKGWIGNQSDLSIAAVNGPHSTVIAGAETAIAPLLQQLDEKAIQYKQLRVSHAFHSPLMDPMLAEFRQVAEAIPFQSPTRPLLSTVTGTWVKDEMAIADYWVNHVRQPVQFLGAMQTLQKHGAGICLEIGAKPILLGLGRGCLPDGNGDQATNRQWLPSLRSGQPDAMTLLHSLAQLYIKGVEMDWSAVTLDLPPEDNVYALSLPTYPFQRQRYWWDEAKVPSLDGPAALVSRSNAQSLALSGAESRTPSSATVGISGGTSTGHPLVGDRIPLAGTNERRFQSLLSPQSPAYLADHCVGGQVVLPGAAYVEMAIAAGLTWSDTSSLTLSNLIIEQPLVLPTGLAREGAADEQVLLQLVLAPASDDQATVQIFSCDRGDTDAAFSRHGQCIISPTPQRLNASTSGSDRTIDPAMGYVVANRSYEHSILSESNLQSIQLALLPYPVNVRDYYQTMAAQSLSYGLAFQGIQQLWCHDGQALSRIYHPVAMNGDAIDDHHLHPVLLDACFQTIGVLVQALYPSDPNRGTYLPVGLDQLQFNQSLNQGWCGITLQGSEDSNNGNGNGIPSLLKADLVIWDDQGEIATTIRGMTLQFVHQSSLAQLFDGKVNADERESYATPDKTERTQTISAQGWFYELVWQAQPKTRTSANLISQNDFPWLIFADSASTTNGMGDTPLGVAVGDRLAAELRGKDQSCVVIKAAPQYKAISEQDYQINPTSPEDWTRLFNDVMPSLINAQGELGCRIAYCWALDMGPLAMDGSVHELEAQHEVWGGVLHLVQAIAQFPTLKAQLWLLTQGTQTLDVPVPISLQQSTLWGLARTLRLEHPDLHCVSIDLPHSIIPHSTTPDTLDGLVADLLDQGEEWEDQIAYGEGGSRFVARLLPDRSTDIPQRLTIPNAESFRLGLSNYGVLDHLALMPIERLLPQAHEVEIQVKASGVNFRDVLNALGMLQETLESMGIMQSADVPFGGECAGVVTAVGSEVSQFQIGDEVIAAQAVGSLRQFVTVPGAFVVHKPSQMSFAEAATVPTTFLTAYYGLVHLAKLQPGEKVLIHAAAGGVGQAAVQVAQSIGAEIFATASSGKWDVLKKMGISHIMNSRTLDFAEEILAVTNGEGIDVVFNSLNGEVIPKNLDVTVTNGRFVEIGKIGIWDNEKIHQQRPDVTYFPFDLLEVSNADPSLITSLLTELMGQFNQQTLTPLPKTVFPIESAPDAFRYMAQAKHIGKVVITLPPIASQQSPIQSDATYLITGGLGALGLQLAQWLVNQGARHLALMGRSAPSASAQQSIHELEQAGATIHCLQADVANLDNLKDALVPFLDWRPTPSPSQEGNWIVQNPKSKIQNPPTPNPFQEGEPTPSPSQEGDRSIQMPPRHALTSQLKGIFHLAGILDDGLMLNQSWERTAAVMMPKLMGAWNLHQLTQTHSLDHFVCFSSIASLMGSPGQSNYAGANAFLDALAHHRRSIGLPGLSLNWGPWAKSGMAAQLGDRNQQRLITQGFTLIPSTQGLDILTDLMTQPQPQLGIIPLDWAKFRAASGSRTQSSQSAPFLKAIYDALQPVESKPNPSKTLQGEWLQELAGCSEIDGATPLPEEHRPSFLTAHLQTQLAKVMGFGSPDLIDPTLPFGDLGMDSLMGVEFSNRLQSTLGCTVSPSLTFDYPTIQALATYLLDNVLDLPEAQAEGRLRQAQPPSQKAEDPVGWVDDRKPNNQKSKRPTPSPSQEGKPTPSPSQEGDRSMQTPQQSNSSTFPLPKAPVSSPKSKIQNPKSERPTPSPSQEGDRSIQTSQRSNAPTLRRPSTSSKIQNLKSKIYSPPPAHYDFALLPDYLRLRQDLDRVSTMGNPFFAVHDGVAKDTTQIQGRSLINYSSYNYLGLSGDPRVTAAAQDAIARYGTSVSASRVVSGERGVHQELEQGIAKFLGTEACIAYIGGHATNVTTIGHVFGPKDLILYDALSHNSIREGCRLSEATAMEFPHNDWQTLDDLLAEHRRHYEKVLVAIEGVYSTDGDVAPLPEFVQVKTKHHAFILVDEAHSIGVLGQRGGGIGDHFGLSAQDVDLWMGTLSKSFASCGGYIAGCAALVEYLKYTAPGFVFSVGMSPANAAAALAALEIIKTEPERVAKVQARSHLFLTLAQEQGLNTGTSQDSPIVPIIVGEPQTAVQLSQILFQQGINVQPMVYPSVPHNQARLRFFMSCLHSETQIRQTIQTVADELMIMKTLASS